MEPQESRRTEKVLVYLTRGRSLLLFRHVHHPEAGVQVPGGTIKPGEGPVAAAHRELAEEAGLTGARFGRVMTRYLYSMAVYGRAELQDRTLVHLTYDGDTPPRWRHAEEDSEGGGAPIDFEFFWHDLDAIPPELIAGHGLFLSQLRQLAS